MKILADGGTNYKMARSGGHGYLLAGLSLRPASLSGYNVCPRSTAGCRAACVLEHAGRSVMPNVRDSRDDKTRRLFTDRKGFLADLHGDLYALERKAKRQQLIPAVRLNVASDIKWERIDPTIFGLHPTIEFYDYTKYTDRTPPENYTLTYSFNEKSDIDQVHAVLERGGNVAVVFDTYYSAKRKDPLPEFWAGYEVIDGDIHDLRLHSLDGHGRIIGLRSKGGKKIRAAGVASGFVQVTTSLGGTIDDESN